MPIVIRTRTKRLTNDQHRVEFEAADLPVGATLSLAGSDDGTGSGAPAEDSASKEDAPKDGLAQLLGIPNTLACDIYLTFECTNVEETGFSRKPDQVLEAHPAEGHKCLVWRGVPIGEKHGFLLKRAKKGAYTVEMNAEAHLRIVTSGASESVTFPPTP